MCNSSIFFFFSYFYIIHCWCYYAVVQKWDFQKCWKLSYILLILPLHEKQNQYFFPFSFSEKHFLFIIFLYFCFVRFDVWISIYYLRILFYFFSFIFFIYLCGVCNVDFIVLVKIANILFKFIYYWCMTHLAWFWYLCAN